MSESKKASLSAETLIAETIMDWLGEEGLLEEYQLLVEPSGVTRLWCRSSFMGECLEKKSVLGPVETVTDLAITLLTSLDDSEEEATSE